MAETITTVIIIIRISIVRNPKRGGLSGSRTWLRLGLEALNSSVQWGCGFKASGSRFRV